MKIEKVIETIPQYPDDGNHQECTLYVEDLYLPFEIRKGEDIYWYIDKNGNESVYNNLKGDKLDKRWIVNLNNDEASKSLKEIFHIEVSYSLDKIIKYCIDIYRKSLFIELDKINNELSVFKNKQEK